MLLNLVVETAQYQQTVARFQQITAQIDQDIKRLAAVAFPNIPAPQINELIAD
jgi:hypothetical protein